MATMDREHTVLDERCWSEIWVLDRISGPRAEILYQCSLPYAYARCRGMLASLLRRSQLPGENENGNWPVCKAPVTLELGDVNPRHFLQCKTCTRPVLRRGALILIDHQHNRQRPPPPPPPPPLLSLSLSFYARRSQSQNGKEELLPLPLLVRFAPPFVDDSREFLARTRTRTMWWNRGDN